jgi:WD40 repeat protein
VPGYQIKGKLGEGGMGVVYKARHIALNRVVALKMILAGGHAREADLLRFRTEAEAIARLQHPNIVQVYEVGEHDGQPFFSLEFCSGGSLERKLNGTPLPPGEAARLVETLARAMHAAHEKNVIHRDLKPANVLLAEDGTPKITDFGLAKKLDDVGQTASGAIMGTPSYMAPEQAGGKSKEMGPAVDVYALGAILYELLTGRPPFKAATALDTIMQVVADEPVSPAQLNAKVPRDLETICLKALAKEPVRRYATGRDLADDLARFTAGMPVLARPVGRIERGWRWCRRNPAVAGLLATVAATLLLGAGVATTLAIVALHNARRADREAVSAREAQQQAEKDAEEARQARTAADNATRQAERSAQEATTKRREAETNLESARRSLANANISQASAALERQTNKIPFPSEPSKRPLIAPAPHVALERPGETIARDLLDRCPPRFRSWDWHYLDWLCDRSLVTLGRHGAGVQALAFLEKGTVVASVDGAGVVTFWTARTGKRLRSFTLAAGKRNAFAFSPDGRLLAVGGTDVELYDMATGKKARSFGGPAPIMGLSFSPDGQRLAASCADNTVRLWSPETGKPIRTLQGAGKAVAFSADGSTLAGAFERFDVEYTASQVLFFNSQTGEVQRTFKDVGGPVALSADGKLLAGIETQPMVFLRSQGYSEVCVVDVAQGKLLHGLDRLVSRYSSVAFHPNSELVAAGSVDHTIKVWQARTGKLAFRLAGHQGTVNAIAFSPDGRLMASASEDHTVKVWDTSTCEGMLALQQKGLYADAVAISPDGRWVAASAFDGVYLWASRETHKLPVPGPTGGRSGVSGLLFTADGNSLVGAMGEQLVVWNVTSRKAEVNYVRAGTHTKEQQDVWLPTSRKIVRTIPCKGKVSRLAVSPDGKRAAALLAATNGLVHTLGVWDLTTGRQVLAVPFSGSRTDGLAFSPDGSWLAVGTSSGVAHLVDAATGRTLLALGKGPGQIQDIAFSPDGRLLAAACTDQVIRVWDVRERKERLTLVGHTAKVSCVAFTPDGLRLISASGDRLLSRFPIKGDVRVWDTESGQNVLTFEAHKSAIYALALSRDGQRLATASLDGTVRVHGRLGPKR